MPRMLKDIPSAARVVGFVGFSFAGNFAYTLACKYDEQFGGKPMVILGDTSLHFSVAKDVKPLSASFHPDLAAALKMTYQGVENLGPMPDRRYDGNVVFLLVGKESGGDISEDWEHLAANMRTIRIDDSHEGLFHNSRHYELYKRLLLHDGAL